MSKNNLRTFIVTGAAGFIGRHCSIELANQNHTTIGIDIKPFPESAEWGMKDFINDDLSINALTSIAEGYSLPCCIIHCAGSGSVISSFEDPFYDFSANVKTTMAVLEFSRRKNSKIAVVIPSSAAVYGSVREIPLREDGSFDPISPYGIHKRITEDIACYYGKYFGVPSAIIRLFSVYGAGLNKQLLWDACIKAVKGEFNFSGSGSEIRDFIHVRDAARLLVQAADRASPSRPIVNGGTGKGTSIKELLNLIGKNWIPGLVPVFNGEERQGDPKTYIADTSILDSWGFKPEIDIYYGVTEYIDWFKKKL